MAVDKEMYKRLGETPPADEPDNGGQSDKGDEGGTGDPDKGDEGGTPPPADAPVKAVLTPEELLARLQEINPEISSLDDIKKKTQPEDEATKKKRKNNAVLSFALKNELINREDYDNYLVDSQKDARQLVFEDYYRKRKAAGADDEKIDREFARLYFEDADEDEDATILAQRKSDLETEARKIIKKNYPEVFTLEEKYDKHINDTIAQKETNDKILSLTKEYTTDVNDIFTSAKFVVNIGDKDNPEVIDFVYPPDILDTVKKEFLRTDTCSSFIANYDKSVLQDAVNLRLQHLSQDKIIAHAAKTYHSRKVEKLKLGRKGILQPDEVGSGANTVQRDEEMYRRLAED